MKTKRFTHFPLTGKRTGGMVSLKNEIPIPIIGYTADAIVHHGVLKQDLHFLQKPFTLTDLAHKVRQAIGKQEERRNREIPNHKT